MAIVCLMSQDKLPSSAEHCVLLSADVAKLLDMTPAGVRAAAVQGRLEAAGRTLGGVRYFTRAAVEKFREVRACRRRNPPLPRVTSRVTGSSESNAFQIASATEAVARRTGTRRRKG